MEQVVHQQNDKLILEMVSPHLLVQSVDDALDSLGSAYYQGFDSLVMYEHQFTEDFFDLKTKLAGEVLQKFSNYRMRLALIGDYSKYTSQALLDFIRESNKTGHIIFCNSLREALQHLSH